MKMNTKILYSLPLAINNGLITVFNSINARFFSSTNEGFVYRKPYSLYTEKGITYGRNFGKWKCFNCKKSWTSAYTWISLNFCFNNKDIFKDKKGKLWFSGNKINNKDLLLEKCNRCDNGNNSNVKIISYNNLERSNNIDNHITHNSNLCAKCLKGSPCQDKKYYSTLSSFNVINSKRFYSTNNNLNNNPINLISYNPKTKIGTFKIWLDYNIFSSGDVKKFINEIFFSNKLIPRRDYSLLIKIKKNDIYLTIAKRQSHFIFDSLNDKSFEKLFDFITDKLIDIFEEYNSVLEYVCDSILLEFRPVNIDEKLKISDIDKVKTEYPKLDIKTINKDLDFFDNPIKDIQGTPLNNKIIEDKLQIFNTFYIENLEEFLFEFNKKKINVDNEENDYFVNDSTKFYLVNRNNRSYIITINGSNNILYKRCFNIHGDLVFKIKDIDNKNGTFTRESRNSTIVYKNNAIISSSRNIKFTPIKNEFKSDKIESTKNWLPNYNIATLDLETYENNGISKCYAIGFYTNEFKECKTYYIDENLNSMMLIHQCITDMFKPRYNKNIFYVHNLGRFDAPFIIKALVDFNNTLEGKENPYRFETRTRNSDILKLIIKRKVNNRTVTIKIQDSVAILPRDLRSLGKDFEVETVKSFWPYDFIQRDTLFYKGKTPNISYYKDISLEEYNSLYRELWSLKEECILYLNKDLISLCQVLVKVNKTFHLLFKVQMTDSLTISNLAMKIFLKDHYDLNKKPIPLVTNRMIWNDLYKAYLGGRVEVYNPVFMKNSPYNVYDPILNKNVTKKSEKIYYYDVNSLYPFASLNLMPGLDWKYIESYEEKLELENLFGYFYCKIKSSNKYIGLLPKRTENGRLTFPNGEWYGWYFTKDLLFAKEYGYDIRIIKGYIANTVEDVFTSFVYKITELKIKAKNPSERNVAKLILNSIIGKFGMDFLKRITKLLNNKNHDIISVTRVLKNSIELNDDLYLDTFKPGIDKEICEEFGVDYIKTLNTESISEKSTTKSYNTVSIPVAISILSYARVHMNQLIMYILNQGGKIYYTDTDSIVTDLKLPEEYVHRSELGKLKLEHEIVEGYFISDKTYAFVDINGKITKKCKGIDSKKLNLEDYKRMYNMESITNATKTTSKRDYAKGSVVITTKNNIKLNIEQYNKRIRIFKNKKWIGTKPLTIKE